MIKNLLFSFFAVSLLLVSSMVLHAQQCELKTTNINFESENSLTFDVTLTNTSASTWSFSHGSFAWTLDASLLNGGSAAFSLVPGFSDFETTAQPTSALITNSNILRTSSNTQGSNGDILAGEELVLYRFRLETSAASFSSEFFSVDWKTQNTPYSRIYSWNNSTVLPEEILSPIFTIDALMLEENFDYGSVANPDLTTITTNWTRHSGSAGPEYLTTSLSYTDYVSSGVGGSVGFHYTSVANGDVNRTFSPISGNTDAFVSFLVNLDSARTQDYFFHLIPDPFSFTYRGRIRARDNGAGWSLGLSKGSSGIVEDLTVLNFAQTYLFVLKYTMSSAATNDDVFTLYVYDTGIPASEPGSPVVTIGPIGAGESGDLANVGAVAIRQGTNTPSGTIDGIRVATTWLDLFPVAGAPAIVVSPTGLSGFSYLVGGGPSASQSYNLSGSDLTPAAGNLTVTGSTNYEVSTDDITFSPSVSVAYIGGTLINTPIYVRLKSGLPGGIYNGEPIANDGGGATTQFVTCNGSVVNPEPTNHATSFAGSLGNPSYHYVILDWIDALGGTLPDSYLIKGSSFHFDSIAVPVDGVEESNSLFVQNVNQGVQTAAFGLNSATTYYFKIFPYTNSGTQVDYKTDGLVPQLSITTDNTFPLPIIENFEYVPGTLLTDNGWLAHSGVGTNSIQVADTTLMYTDYINSGLGKAAAMSLSGEDVNRSFNSPTSQSIYASFMVNITAAQTGTYFFHFAPENSSFLYYCKTFVKNDGLDNLAFGVSKRNTGDASYTPFNYALNTTYLIVVEYIFNPATATDDTVKLWVNPVLNGTEPIADIVQTDLGTDADSLGMFALRQGSFSTAPDLKLGGIRVANTWLPGAGGSTFSLSVSVLDGWNMVSIPGLHPTDQNVLTWWSGKDPAAAVFGFNGSYSVVTTVAPGAGYWMKHSGANVYDTGDEWPAINIVTHDPIPGISGWNLIGGYENLATTSLITTTPSGLVTGPVFGFSGGYSVATTLEPGFAYWIKLTGAGDINIPSTLSSKSGKEPVEYFKEEWGRIIITDNAGRNFILYAVTENVNLDNYEMPPAPPEGSFDIRFSSNRIAEDINAAIQTIEMSSGVEYPIVVRVENMDIRIQDESGRLLNEVIESGQQITINSQLSKLVVTGELVPEVYALEQNYPNPFNPSTVIEFSLPENVSNVRLTIYNALGERVAELVNTTLEAGKYSYQWDATNVATGMYIYELRTEKFVSVKKMLMIK